MDYGKEFISKGERKVKDLSKKTVLYEDLDIFLKLILPITLTRIARVNISTFPSRIHWTKDCQHDA